MGYMENFRSLDGQRGLFSLILTATILTVFEIVFFYKIVAPGVIQNMNNGLNNVGKVIGTKLDETTDKIEENTKDPLQKVIISKIIDFISSGNSSAILSTFASREKKLTDDINLYTKKTGILIISLLCLLLFFIYNNIKGLSKQEGQVVGLGVPVKTALLTVFILIAFQTLFYFFGQKFRYPGTMGNEELLYEMQKNMVVNEDNLYKDDILSSLIKNKDVVKSMMSENNNYGQQQQQQQQEVEQTELELEDNVDQTEGSLISNLTGVANSVMDNIEDLGDELEIIKDTASNIKNNYMLL